jgi:hypothetical protein
VHTFHQETPNVPNDAKLGLVIGVGVVIAVAVVFFRKEVVSPLTNEATAAVGAAKAGAPKAAAGVNRAVKAKATSRGTNVSKPSAPSNRDADLPTSPGEQGMLPAGDGSDGEQP